MLCGARMTVALYMSLYCEVQLEEIMGGDFVVVNE